MKKTLMIGVAAVLVIVIVLLWLRWGPRSWEVQITGVTGDGRNVQYRIETLYPNTADTLIFRNEDTGFFPPYLKFDSADLQSIASRVARQCANVPVTVKGYGWRIAWLDMFPNATAIDAPHQCVDAPSDLPRPGGAN
jgi:hypothetical protein